MRFRGILLLGALCAGPAAAQDYAWQWPIELPQPGEPAYELPLDEEVYAALVDPMLRDLLVVDAAGTPQPAAMLPLRAPEQGEARLESVPWFLLPGDGSEATRAGALDGRFESAGVALSWKVPEGGSVTPPELLLDLGSEPGDVRAIELEPAGESAMWRARIEVSSSADLQRWRPVAGPTALYRLSQDGHRLALLRIALDRAPERYLRLRHAAESARGEVSGLRIERRDAPSADRDPIRWLRLQAESSAEGRLFEYRLPGPMRIESWSLDAGQGNWVVRATLSSRASDQSGWRRQDETERYRWQIDGDAVVSPPARLSPARDRHWRLELGEARSAAPELLLGYRPDRLLLLPEGAAPYRLLAGSGDGRRTDAPTRAVLAMIRQHRGEDWQPVEASLGARSALAGEAALTPTRAPVDWRTALLWAVLIAVAGSVVVIALKLLRSGEGPPSG